MEERGRGSSPDLRAFRSEARGTRGQRVSMDWTERFRSIRSHWYYWTRVRTWSRSSLMTLEKVVWKSVQGGPSVVQVHFCCKDLQWRIHRGIRGYKEGDRDIEEVPSPEFSLLLGCRQQWEFYLGRSSFGQGADHLQIVMDYCQAGSVDDVMNGCNDVFSGDL